MNEKKEITILVATFNKKDTIRTCIESLLNLNFAPDRIMVLDGFSTDGTYEILKEYKNKIDLFQFKTGLSTRLNWGLNHIGTEYVALTDADCTVNPDWLSELIKGFDEGKDVIATAGYCGTPKGLPLFPTLIGLELESRFQKFPKYILRAPTMNLCLKTEIARKVKFDEKQPVGVETDFGYRLTKFGRMAYVPNAKVLHYHRATLKGFFKQQREYAMGGTRIVLKHGKRALGDHITTSKMIIQIPLFFIALFCLLISFFSTIFLYPAIIALAIILIIYIKNIIEMKPPFAYCFLFLPFFLFRTIAWSIGILSGINIVFSEIFKKHTPDLNTKN